MSRLQIKSKKNNYDKRRSEKRQAELKNRIETYLDDIKRLNDEMSELETIINKKDNWRDKLTKGNYIIGRGLNGMEAWHGFNRLEAEHTFKTEEQAQLLADKINLMQQMHAFAYARNDGWVPDWEIPSIKKWGLSINNVEGSYFDFRFRGNSFIFGIAVKSEKIAEEMLEEFGERIEKIYNKQY